MSEDLQPDAIRTRSFSTARRGFERSEVEEFQKEVAAQVADLQGRLSALDDRLGQLGITELPDLKVEFDTVAEDVRDILQAARDAAEDMRDRAKADAASLVATSQEESEALRAEAWETAQNMVEGVTAEVAGISSKAAEDALFVRAEAEREALRLTGNAKRDAEELTASSQLNAEKVLAQATAEAERATAEATQSIELAEERVRALEERRDELMLELEAARETLAAVEDRIAGRTEELTHATTDPSETSVRVLTTDDDEETPEIGAWLDEEATVRLVPPPPEVVLGPVDADQLVAEVESLRSVPSPPDIDEEESSDLERLSGGSGSSAESVSLDFEITSGDAIVSADSSATAELSVEPEAAEPAAGAVAEPTPIIEPEPAPEPIVEPEPEPEPELEAEPEPSDGGIDDLFASLRSPAAEPAPTAPPIEEPPPAPLPDTTAANVIDPASEPPPVTTPHFDSATDPLDLRDRRLFPVTNEVLRGIKREIVDLQNAVLEELRTESAEWRPKKAMFQRVLGEGAATLAGRSYGEGVAAAGELAERTPPELSDMSSHDLSSLVTDLWEAVVDAIDGSTGGGSRERGASVGRVFRAWRTDEAERRVLAVARAEYNTGVAAGLGAMGLEHAVVPAGRDLADPESTVIPAS